MKKNSIHILLFMLLAMPLRAQFIALLSDTTIRKFSIDIQAGYQVGSNSLTNNLYKIIYTGSEILENEKNSILLRSTEKANRFGADQNSTINCVYHPESLFKKNNPYHFLLQRVHQSVQKKCALLEIHGIKYQN